MQEYKIILTWEAIYDVTDITDYIEEDLGQNVLNRFQSDSKRTNENLGQFHNCLSPTKFCTEDIPYIKIFSAIYYFLYYNGRNKRDSYSPSVAP